MMLKLGIATMKALGRKKGGRCISSLRNVLHEPVNGVVRVRGMVHFARVKRSPQRAGHHVLPVRTVLATYVMKDVNVAATKTSSP